MGLRCSHQCLGKHVSQPVTPTKDKATVTFDFMYFYVVQSLFEDPECLSYTEPIYPSTGIRCWWVLLTFPVSIRKLAPLGRGPPSLHWTSQSNTTVAAAMIQVCRPVRGEVHYKVLQSPTKTTFSFSGMVKISSSSLILCESRSFITDRA